MQALIIWNQDLLSFFTGAKLCFPASIHLRICMGLVSSKAWTTEIACSVLRITMMSTTSYFMKLMSINLDRLKFPEDN
jgi:hypothetical protein